MTYNLEEPSLSSRTSKLLMPYSNDNHKMIRKSNELIEARYRLGVGEQRLVLLLASEISPSDDDFQDYEVRVTDFARMFNLESDKSLYEKVEQAAENLLGKIITLTDGPDVERTVWLSYVKYIKGSGVVKIRFDKSLKPYLLQLQGHFTQYNLKHVIGFKSQYSIRLYELIKMEAFKAKNEKIEKTFTLVDLKDFLGIGKKEYSAFDNFRRRVLEPAVKEISAQTDLNIIAVNKIKSGRKITSIVIVASIISEKMMQEKQKSLIFGEENKNSESEIHPIISSLLELGFSMDIARAYKSRYGVRRIERNVAYTLAKKQDGVIKDIPAYLNKAITEDMGGSWESAQIKQKEDSDRKEAEAIKREELAAQIHFEKMQELAEGSKQPVQKTKPDTAKTAIMARQLGALLDDHEG